MKNKMRQLVKKVFVAVLIASVIFPSIGTYLIPDMLTTYAEEAEAERLCCIMDPEGKIIGARHLIVSGKKAYGWVGIEEQYQVRYGAALIFLGHALEYIVKNDVQMCSWVMTTNVPSIEYHERLNTKWTGYYCDEWVLEAAE